MDLAGSLGPWTRPGSIQLQYQLQAMSQSSHSTNDRAELPPQNNPAMHCTCTAAKATRPYTAWLTSYLPPQSAATDIMPYIIPSSRI